MTAKAKTKAARRISALLALAADQEGTPEGHAAFALAARLAHEHAVACCRLPDQGACVETRFKAVRNALWLAMLADGIGRYTHVRVLRSRGRLTLIGLPADLDRHWAMYLRAEAEINAEARDYLQEFDHPSPRSAGDSFRKGMTAGFGRRLAEWRREAEAASSTPATATALVMVGRDLAVDAVYQKIARRPGRRLQPGDRSAYSQGYTAGLAMTYTRGDIATNGD